jgi:hypothetical protein
MAIVCYVGAKSTVLQEILDIEASLLYSYYNKKIIFAIAVSLGKRITRKPGVTTVA